MDLIDRHRKWKLTHFNDTDSDSDASEQENSDSADSDWDIGTIKEPVSPYIEASKPVAVGVGVNNKAEKKPVVETNGHSVVNVGGGGNESVSAAVEVNRGQRSASPAKEKARVEVSPVSKKGGLLGWKFWNLTVVNV